MCPAAINPQMVAAYISCMAFKASDSLLSDVYMRLSMWWAQRTERRLAVRRYRLELRETRRRRYPSECPTLLRGDYW